MQPRASQGTQARTMVCGKSAHDIIPPPKVKPAATSETILVRISRALRVTPGMRITVAFDPRDVHLFDPDSGDRVIKWHGPRHRSAAEEIETFLGESID